MMAMPWSPIVPETTMRSPGRAARIESDRPSGTRPMPGGGDEDLVALAAVDDLGVAGDQRDARLVAGRAHRATIRSQVGERQTFLEDERRREKSGSAPPTARSLTVPWTASRPMSPPGKKSGRTTNESVVKASRGRLHAVARAEPDGRLILQRGEHVVAERRHEQPLDQVGGQRPPLPWPSTMWSYCDRGSGQVPEGSAIDRRRHRSPSRSRRTWRAHPADR